MHIHVNVKFLRQAAALYTTGPLRGTACSAGFDLCADLEEELSLRPGDRFLIPTGLSLEIQEEGVAGFVYSRSGLGGITGLVVAQGVGVIDPDYRGEIKVPLLNTGQSPQVVVRGARVAQLIFQPFYPARFTPVDDLGRTGRGEGGFGHTGSI